MEGAKCEHNESAKKIDISLYGGIGNEVDCNYVSSFIDSYSGKGYELNVKINTEGGYTSPGTSIVGSMLNFDGIVNTQNDGMAYSWGAVLLQIAKFKGGKRKCRDYSSVMVHKASFPKGLDLSESDNIYLSCENFKIDMILKNACGDKYKDEWMDGNDHFFQGGENALTAGLCDEVIKTGKTVDFTDKTVAYKACAMLLKEETKQVTNSNSNNMSELKVMASLLGCGETLDAITAAIIGLKTAEATSKGDVVALKLKNENLEKQISDSVDASKNAFIEDCAEKGLIAKDKVQTVKASCKLMSLEQTRELLGTFTPVHNKIPIENGGAKLPVHGAGAVDFSTMDFDTIMKSDSGELYLENLKKTNIVAYHKIISK